MSQNGPVIRRSSPQIAQVSSISSTMLDVIVALLPALGMAVYLFGPRVLALTLVSVAACMGAEYGYRRLMGLSNTVGDLSACVTGLLLAFNLLGDGLRDLELALTLYPKLRAYSVAGNCDYGALEPTDGLAAFDGVVIFYTHGHMYGVKYDLDTLADAASARGAEVALFGHTHIPHAETRGGVFLFNPGSCGRCYTGPDTYGILTLDGGKVTAYEHKEVPKQ